MTANASAVDVNVVGENLVVTVGGTEALKSPVAKINSSYVMREFCRGLKLRIDNAAAGVPEEKKVASKLEMVKKMDLTAPDGGITGGRKKESAEAFLKRVLPTIKDVTSYQAAVADCQASVRKDEQSEAMVELSAKLTDILPK